ncbi:MAG TPA: saccharopine dehydrogenase C-terminal domain-containing protein [Candidatus Solibacter sp.]|nr:saccharopine dehydrogenase C-terminal domain-containing protein [Candidatus Solibacter sp.]
MAYSYIILGAGRQGVAAAYDLMLFGESSRITLADCDGELARDAANQVNALLNRNIADAIALDVRDDAAVRRALQGHHVALSAVPYFYNLPLTRAAIECGVSFCDLGGNTDIVRQQHALDREALRAGVSVVADCGMGPGMGNTLAVYAMGLVGEAEHVCLYDGGLPQKPQPPWNYALTFSIEGLTNEYYGGMTILRNGELFHAPCFTEFEMVNIPPIGRLEAFLIAGGASTAPWTFRGRVQTYQLKVLRYPGTFAQLKAFSDLGLFDPRPIQVDGNQVIPRKVFHALFEPQVRVDHLKDVCIIRVVAVGRKNGQRAEATVEVIDYYDEKTGFTAMQRTTGWHLSIVAAMIAKGEIAAGSVPLELAVPAGAFVQEARKRGFKITEEIVALGETELAYTPPK